MRDLVIVGSLFLVLCCVAQLNQAESTGDLRELSQTINVQYKTDIYLRCGEKRYKLTKKEREQSRNDIDEDTANDNDDVQDREIERELEDTDGNDIDEDDGDDNNDGVNDNFFDDDDDEHDDDTDKSTLKNVTFYMIRNGTERKIDYDRVKFFYRRKDKVLKVIDLKREEIESQFFCNSTVNKTRVNFLFKVAPFLYVPEHPSKTVVDGGSVNITCKLLYGFEKDTKIEWKWFLNDKKIDQIADLNYTIESSAEEHVSTLQLFNLTTENRGEIECMAKNPYGDHIRRVILRVKSPFGPVWPALAILTVVILLLVIIFSCEIAKKGRDNKPDKLLS